MIRRIWNKDKWLLTPQIEHARLAGLMAASWNYPGERPHEEALQACARHDDGWKQCDEDPLINRAGQPASFFDLAPDITTPCWDISIKQLKNEGKPYAAALVAAHFIALAENADLARLSVRGAAALGAFIGTTRIDMQVQKLEAASKEINTDHFDNDLRLLQVCDELSILILSDFNGQLTISDVPYLREGASEIKVNKKPESLAITIDPFPFKNNLRDHATSWLIPFQEISADELGDQLRNTKPVTNELHIGAGV